MNLALTHIPRRVNPVYVLVLSYFIALAILGKSFTKLQIAGPLYLHDLVLFIITVICVFTTRKIILPGLGIFLLIGLALLYFVYSLIKIKNNPEIQLLAFRQFGTFIYLGCCYLVFSSLVKTIHQSLQAINLIRFLAQLAVLLQFLYLGYGFIFIPGFSLLGQTDYNYYSPLVIMGVIIYCADVLSYEKKPLIKIFKLFPGIGLSLTLGHSSAFLAVFMIIMLYCFIKIKPYQRYFSWLFIVCGVVALFFLPQFTDANASWRLLYWKHVLDRSITENYGLLGHGFGQPYMTHDFAVFLDNKLNSKIMLDELYPRASYLNPPHNSILTIIFHIGLFASLLFFLPLRNYFTQIFIHRFPADTNVLFLVLALTGSLVWISFNVILELPHSSAYFWLIYFTCVFYLSSNKKITAL